MNPTPAFTDADARAAWNGAAASWDHFVESGADFYRHEVHGPGLLAACGDVAGLAVLDVGCGQGFFSRQLARRGARVAGVDLAEELLALARAQEQQNPLGIDYVLLSATEVNQRWQEHFDLVTGCMSIQDVADVPAALRAAFGGLRQEGRLVFSVPHPCTDTPYREWERENGEKKTLKVDRYFESGPAVCQWNFARLRSHWTTPYWRYTLTEWTELLAGAGFFLRRLHEPRPTAEQVRRWPDLDDCYRVPFFLVFDLVKGRKSPEIQPR